MSTTFSARLRAATATLTCASAVGVLAYALALRARARRGRCDAGGVKNDTGSAREHRGSPSRADDDADDGDGDDDDESLGDEALTTSLSTSPTSSRATSRRASAGSMTEIITRAATCAYCAVDTATRRCEQCRAIFYCSPKCQRTHWVEEHREVCEPHAEMDEVRAMYHVAMNALSTWDADRGYAPVVDMFSHIMSRAAQVGDKNLECEAALIIAEIEINSIRRAYTVNELEDVRGGIDAEQFERITSATLRLAYDNKDKISEARAHLAVGDYYSMAMGDHEAALEHYGLARAYAKEEDMLPIETEACRRMRWTQSIRGDIDGAAVLSEEVLRLTRAYIAEQRHIASKAQDAEASLHDSGSGSPPTVPMMLREHWYLGGYENQEVYALKEHGCALRGERRMFERALVVARYQPAAVEAFEEALTKLEKHWRRHGLDAESDAEGADIKRQLHLHLADLYDNYLASADDVIKSQHHAKAVECRHAYEDMVPGSFGADVACALCDAPLGGLSIEDEPLAMTCAWDSCAKMHHFHTRCFNTIATDANPGVMCPACPPR
mmetsp:Transcript_5865/g.21221  ORF Transcript_5865/g.21221 Transcript_5865/m.21221 type:complete len:554 (-) Transcript_5865:236-1897(-)